MNVLAVDLGGTKTALAVIDDGGRIDRRQKLPAERSLQNSVAQIAAAATDGVDAVGVIVPGIFTPSTGRAWCPNLWGTDEVPLLDALRRSLRVPVVVDSDRAGYVLGEAWLGAARGLADVVFVAFGTGIGAGILADGRVVRGAHGIAGAVGWMAIRPDWDVRCGEVGCWESESAGPGIALAAGMHDTAAVVKAARAGDEAARGALAAAARASGRGIANLISLLNPEAVVLGGGVMQGAADVLLDPIRSEARRWAQPIAAARCRIELTQLGEDAGLLGAARLALTHS